MKKRTFRIICACTIFLPVYIFLYTLIFIFLILHFILYPFLETGDGDEEIKIDEWEETKKVLTLPINNYLNTGHFSGISESDTPRDSEENY